MVAEFATMFIAVRRLSTGEVGLETALVVNVKSPLLALLPLPSCDLTWK
jgi:hypothetical protein